jgi:hypothetical protein
MAKFVKAEGRPSVNKALHAVARDADPEGHDIKRLSIHILQTGEVSYKMHTQEDDVELAGLVRVE